LIRKSAISILAVLLGGLPVSAQDYDKPRGTGRGCIHTERPPNSPITKVRKGGITTAFYAGATDEYAHGVLGDAIEAKTIVINLPDRKGFCDQITAPENTVFEDVAPRLADVTGDGQNEIIVVNSHQDFGARLAIYGYPAVGQDITLIAATPYIGRPSRWLAPVGIADFNGDGAMDVAYVDRPHLAKTLRVWTYRKGSLTEIANQTGLSNHRIGDDYIMGGVRNCGGSPQMITSDANLVSRDIGPAKNRRSYSKALNC